MENKNDIMDGIEEAKERLDDVMEEFEEKKKEFEEVKRKREDLENTILDLRVSYERKCLRDGSFHDQMAYDFDIDKDAKGRTRIEKNPRHNKRWDLCKCRIQCPQCKGYGVVFNYKKTRNPLAHEKERFDYELVEGEKIGPYYYCSDCGDEMDLLGDEE